MKAKATLPKLPANAVKAQPEDIEFVEVSTHGSWPWYTLSAYSFPCLPTTVILHEAICTFTQRPCLIASAEGPGQAVAVQQARCCTPAEGGL